MVISKKLTGINRWMFVSIALILKTVGYGQIPKIIPPSPTAASLGQYGDIPISNYTGVPSISIPLYTIKSGEIELPISISYHSSGIKVGQEASITGLGWALNAGGVITRQINGRDDFVSTWGYIQAPPLPPLTQLNKVVLGYSMGLPGTGQGPFFEFYKLYPDAYAQAELSEHGTQDTQPDVFYYSFFGYSGKLIFQKQASGPITATAIDQNNLRFIYHATDQEWEVTNGDGWKYFFSTSEVTRSGGSLEPSASLNTVSTNGPQSFDMTSAWYIDRVVSPSGDEITFTYSRTGRWLLSPVYYGERSSRNSMLKVNNSPGICFSNTDSYSLYTASQTVTDEVYLTRIDFNNGYVIFNRHPQNRLDRKANSLTGSTVIAPYLNSFDVYDKTGKATKTVEFNYSYFRNDKINAPDKENYLRLRLDYLQESFRKENGQYVKIPPYRFTYDETPLPAKNSFSTDHWGYNNGADNSQIRGYKFFDLPTTSMAHSVHQETTTSKAYISPRFLHTNTASIFINGANREPHAVKSKAAILTSIKYPTGGVSIFNYEPNDYWDPNEPTFEENDVSLNVSSLGTTEKTFTLTKTTFVFLSFNLVNHMYHGDPTNPNVMNNMTAVLEKTDGTDVLKFIPSDSQMDGQSGGNNNVDKMEAHVCVALRPGSYRIITNHGGYLYLSMSLTATYSNLVQTYKKIGPGLRIQSINNYSNEGGSVLTRKIFKYEEAGKSTGRLLAKVQSFYDESDMMLKLFSGESYYTPCCYINSVVNPSNPPVSHKIISSSASVLPLGSSAQGNPIGYDVVTIYNEDSEGNTLGKSLYHYKNYEEAAPAIFIPNLPQRIYVENGQLFREKHFNSSSQLIKEKEVLYKRDPATQLHIMGMMTHRSYNDWVLPDGYTYPASLLPAFVGVYDIYSEWWYPEQAIETTYDVSGLNPITETIQYEYGNSAHKLLTKTTQTTSDNKVLVTTNAYPSDLPAGTNTSSATFSRMIQENILNPIVKQEAQLDGTLINGSINNYIIDPHDRIVLSSVQKVKSGTNTYETRVNYDQYDDNGRIVQLTNTRGITTSYIWSYNNEYPVVKAENVDYTTLKAAVETAAGTTNLQNFWATFSNITYPNTAWNNFNATLRNAISLKDAVISTYTYNPLTGVTAETDANSRTAYYEYDDHKRLKWIRDDKGNILRDFKYHYALD